MLNEVYRNQEYLAKLVIGTGIVIIACILMLTLVLGAILKIYSQTLEPSSVYLLNWLMSIAIIFQGLSIIVGVYIYSNKID